MGVVGGDDEQGGSAVVGDKLDCGASWKLYHCKEVF